MSVDLKGGQPAELVALKDIRKELEEIRKGARNAKYISIIAIIVSILSPLFYSII